MVGGTTVAVGAPLADKGLMLVMVLCVFAGELLWCGCTGADCLCRVLVGEERGRMLAVCMMAVSVVLELEYRKLFNDNYISS